MYKNSSYSHGGYAYNGYQDHQDYVGQYEGSNDYGQSRYQQQYNYPQNAAKRKSPQKSKQKAKQYAIRSQDQFDDLYADKMPQSSSSSQYDPSYGYSDTKSSYKKKNSSIQDHRQTTDYGQTEAEQYDGGYHQEWYDDHIYPPDDSYNVYDEYGDSSGVHHSDYDNKHGSLQSDAYMSNQYGPEVSKDHHWTHKNEILEHAEKRSKYQVSDHSKSNFISNKKVKNGKPVKQAVHSREEALQNKKLGLGNQKGGKGPNSDKKGGQFNQQESQKAKSNQNQITKRRQYVCYVCRIGLQELEKDFYPCNCKYQICFACYYHQVNECERKCPNCHKHYEVARVEEYKQNRLQQKSGPKDAQEQDLRYKIAEKYEDKISSKKLGPQKKDAQLSKVISPLIKNFEQGQPKLRTDEDIPLLKSQETEKLIKTSHMVQNPDDQGLGDNQQTPTVQQKYDLVSKNNQDQDDILESSLQNCKFQQLNGPEPEDSECMDIASLKSSQTYKIQCNRQTQQQSAIAEENLRRRTNSQENRITSQSQFLQKSISQNGCSFSGPHGQDVQLSKHFSASLQGGSVLAGLPLQFPSTKGIKLSKVRIIQQTIVYAIGLSPVLADEAAMRRPENFGQYGKIRSISLNREKAYSQHLPSEAAESSSSSRSQISYGAYITYQTPQEASLAILALDQHSHEGRLIRASYGRTKYCKFYLKKTACQNKACPYYHKECTDSDILTPDDMQKRALYQYSQQLAISISKIAEMTESQFKGMVKEKQAEGGPQGTISAGKSPQALPRIESILENKELMSLVNQVRNSVQQSPQVKAARDMQVDPPCSNPKGKTKQPPASQKTPGTNQQGTTQTLVSKGKKASAPQALAHAGVITQNNSQLKQIYKPKAPLAPTKIDKPQGSQVIRQLRSGSQRDNHRQESERKLLGQADSKAKAQALPLRPNLTPRRNSHSYSRMLSQSRTQIQLGDIKKKHQGNGQVDKVQLNNKVTDFIAKQNQKQLHRGLLYLQQNAVGVDTEVVDTDNMAPSAQEYREGGSATNASKQAVPGRRLNRMISKENLQADKSERERAQLVGNSNTSGISRNKRYYGDRRKSVSKSIQRGQRETSLPSLFDYTLKFLNDDMAITKREQEPLIEQIVEDDVLENQSQLNKRIFPNQMLNQLEEQYDAKSSYFSNGGSRGQGGLEINLKTMNNIYTSHCFLINSQNHKQSYNESVHQIWEKFDSIDNQLTLKNLYSNSENKIEVTQHDSFSQQDRRHSLLMQSQNNMGVQQPYPLPTSGHPSQNAPKEHLQSTFLSYYRHAASQSQMNVTAQPFFQKGNNSTNHSGFNQPQNQHSATPQMPAGSPGMPPDGFNNLSGTKKPQPVLNEKNLYLFNKQQDEQFDRQRHWSNIFLPAPKQVASSRGAITDPEGNSQRIGNQELNGNIMSSTNNLLTSQSVFCFPMGVDSREEYHEGPRNGESVQKLSTNDNLQLSDKMKNDIKSNGAAGDNSSSFGKHPLQKKRKSMYSRRDIPSDTELNSKQHELSQINTTGAFSGNFSPQKQSKAAASKSIVQPVTKFKMGSNPSLYQDQTEHTNTCRHSNMQKSNTNELYTADGFKDDDFDRRSAGERFGNAQSSAYHELMKVNNLFSGVAFKRRNSCSKSQSHSRVRMHPSIYHNEEYYFPLKKPDNQQNNINQFQNTPIDLTQVYIANTEGQGSLESLLSPISKIIEASPLKMNNTSIKKSWSEYQK